MTETATPRNTTLADVSSKPTKTALLYLRVSTMRQATKGGEEEGYSIPAQRRACIAKATELDAAVLGEFVDAGQSARSADRPELQAMLARVQEGGIDYVIVHKIDRLARSLPDHIAITMALQQAGVELKSVTEVIDETPTGKLTQGLLATFAEFYSSNLAAEAKKGMLEKVRRGGTPGLAPVGYLNVSRIFGDRDGKTVEVDPERGLHITWAYKAYATGNWSISDLVEALEERGLRSRETKKMTGVPLNDAQVHRLLKNPYYKGTITYRGVEYPGSHPPLVDEGTWNKVQTILTDRRSLLATHPLPQGKRLLLSLRLAPWLRKIPWHGRHLHLPVLSRAAHQADRLRPALHPG